MAGLVIGCLALSSCSKSQDEVFVPANDQVNPSLVTTKAEQHQPFVGLVNSSVGWKVRIDEEERCKQDYTFQHVTYTYGPSSGMQHIEYYWQTQSDYVVGPELGESGSNLPMIKRSIDPNEWWPTYYISAAPVSPPSVTTRWLKVQVMRKYVPIPETNKPFFLYDAQTNNWMVNRPDAGDYFVWSIVGPCTVGGRHLVQ